MLAAGGCGLGTVAQWTGAGGEGLPLPAEREGWVLGGGDVRCCQGGRFAALDALGWLAWNEREVSSKHAITFKMN
jgi:hypothetical protein